MKTNTALPASNAGVRCSVFDVSLGRAIGFLLAVAGLAAACGTGLAQAVPPQITPTVSFQHQAVHVGTNAFFSVIASGTAPLSYQWRLDGNDLPGQTASNIVFNPVTPADEGDYTVVVSNEAGVVVSESARLWVVPPPSAFIRGDYTNGTFRFPYYYLMPANYDPGRSYPLFFLFHGGGGNEMNFTNGTGGPAGGPGYGHYPAFQVFASYRQQERDPAIVVWPTLRVGYSTWVSEFVLQATNLIDDLMAKFSIDTNRMYTGGGSAGVWAAWNLLGLRSGFFAGAMLFAGNAGSTPAARIKDTPIWAVCARDDDANMLPGTQSLVRSLRAAGGNPLYTEYETGQHFGGILMGMSTPAVVDWLSAQRSGFPSAAEPLLSITSPTEDATYTKGASLLNLAGTAAALGHAISQVGWTNTATGATGLASGAEAWSAADIAISPTSTNVLVVTGTTISWAPAFGGNTTFNDTLTVCPAPLHVSASPDPVALDCELAYTISIGNYTGRSATGVKLTNVLAPDLQFIGVTTSQGSCANSQGIVSCDIGTLAAPGTATVVIVVQPMSLGTFTNLASITANEADFVPFDPAVTNVITALLISEQPQSQTVRATSNVTFRVKAPCGPQTAYQWQHNGIPVPGATTDTLTLTNVQVPDEGSYNVLISHPLGNALSDSATLTVLLKPVVIQPPLSQSVVVGGNVTLCVEITGNPPPFTYRWRRTTGPITNMVLNERICFLTLTNVQTNQTNYSVSITNAALGGAGAQVAFQLTVLTDTNSNTLPDVWEAAFGISDPALDNDGDGMSNWEEYVAGCNPTNATDSLHLDSVPTEAGVLLRFAAMSNATYTVQSRADLDSAHWLRATDVPARATNRIVELLDGISPAGGQRFYRLITPRSP